MSQYNSLHHTFDINIATAYGIEEAIVIHHFQHWISVNARLKRNFHNGKYWTYQTLNEIAARFPYFTPDKVRDILYKLAHGKNRKSKKEELDFEPVLEIENFNKSKFDRTVWYAFKDQEKFITLCNQNTDSKNVSHLGKSPNQSGEIPKPIPDTKTNTERNTPLKPPSCSSLGGASASSAVEDFSFDSHDDSSQATLDLLGTDGGNSRQDHQSKSHDDSSCLNPINSQKYNQTTLQNAPGSSQSSCVGLKDPEQCNGSHHTKTSQQKALKREIPKNHIRIGDKVHMTQEKFNGLIQDYGKKITDWIIEEINDYCVAKGTKYQNYDRTARNWIKRKMRDARSKMDADDKDILETLKQDIEGFNEYEHLLM